MLTAVPKAWLSSDFAIRSDHGPVTEVELAWFREAGSFALGGRAYQVYREPGFGPFALAAEGMIVARAEKPSAFRDRFVVSYDGAEHVLERVSVWRRAFALYDGDPLIGTMEPAGAFSREARIDLPDRLPLAVRIFLVWLMLITWRRGEAAALLPAFLPVALYAGHLVAGA
jgi:hypothetical protein